MEISLIAIYYLYIIITVVFIILDNKQPASAYAWIFVITFLPVVGLVFYLLFGKDWKRRAKKKETLLQYLQKYLGTAIDVLIKNQKKEIQKLKNKKAYRKDLVELLYRNSNSLLTSTNKIQVFQNGKEKFSHLKEDLKKAKKYIHMEYFIWRSDKLGNEIKEILIEKVKQGVEVRILCDAVGSLLISKNYVKELRKNGIQFHNSRNLTAFFRLSTLNYRNHRKIVAIDGEIGYTGGMNLGQEYIDGGKRFKIWRDTHLRIEGPEASHLQAIFAMSWYTTTNEKLFSQKYYNIVNRGNVATQITTSGPDSKWNSIKQLYLSLIATSKKYVWIQSPYFVPDLSISDALKNAALSGIDVRIMVTGVPDKKIPYWAAFTFFEELLEAGVKVYHYKKGFFHAKTINTDGELCSIGTANMDIRSFNLNYELNTLIYDERIAKKLEKDFLHDLKSCKEFTAKKYEELPKLVKARNSISRLFAPLL